MPVSLFGGLTVVASDGETLNLPTRKTALALAVLGLLGDKGAPREALAEWIWPERSEGQARSSLRQALTAIRKALPSILGGAALEAELDAVKLTGPEGLIDVRLFEALAISHSFDDRARAAALYTGDLLEGVTLPPPLETMVAAHRERFRQRALTLVEALSEQPGMADDARTACEGLANRLLAAEPAAEPAHRAIIRLRLSEGQPNAARRQLERCAAAVKHELGVEAEAKTMALLDAVNTDSATGAGGGSPPGPSAASAQRTALSEWQRARPSVVVMPFDNLGPQQDGFFADGVVEEITSALSRIKDFFVIARQSAYAYKGRFVDVREIGHDLSVRYVVEGTVRRGGERVRITVQLVEADSGTQLWSDRYEGNTTDIFDLQDRIASHVAGAINPSIRASEIELAKRTPPENLQAYDYVLRAFPHFWAHRKALELFAAALKRDPDYGVALAFKAWCHAQEACYLWAENPGQERATAIASAEQAALRVTDHATALAAIGAAYSLTTTDQDLAASFIDRSLLLDPNNAWAWIRAGWLAVLYHRQSNAFECFERARALSPFDPLTFNIYFGMAAAHGKNGDFVTAIELVEEGLRAGPGVTWAYRLLAAFHAQAGNREKAAEAVAQFMRHYPGITIEKMRQGLPPSLAASNPAYWEGFRKAGIPES